MKKIFVGIFVLICASSLFACDFSEKDQFGYFTHNGYALTSFKENDITYNNAVDLLNSASYTSFTSLYTTSTDDTVDLGLTSEQIKEIEIIYKSVTVTTSYWYNDKQFEKVDIEYELEEILGNNKFSIVNSMVVNNIVLTSDLLNHYNQIDLDFKADIYYSKAPILDKYTYHTDSDGNFVLAISDFSTNTATVSGTNTMEIHQTEAIYNHHNLITQYQASFGYQYPTPGGTENVGTVLEVSFEWNLKV